MQVEKILGEILQMIVIILGMHKSGTTLVAKTLHESGVHMGVEGTGDYPKCKYEDPYISMITKQIIWGSQRRHSLDIPGEFNIDEKELLILKEYIKNRIKRHGTNWGFKFPDVTLMYDIWKDILPYHTAIGIKRDRKDIVAHYMRRRKQTHDPKKINHACDIYESRMYAAGVPVVNYEDIMKFGPIMLEDILKIPLKDCRRFK